MTEMHTASVTGRDSENEIDAVPHPFTPDDAWVDEFEKQLTPTLIDRLRNYARPRGLAVPAAGRKVDDYYARKLVQDAIGDTWSGVLTWDPKKYALEYHLLRAIQARAHKHRLHARDNRHDAMGDDTNASRVAEQDASSLVADPEHSARRVFAQETMSQIRAAASDGKPVLRMLDAYDARADQGRRSRVHADEGAHLSQRSHPPEANRAEPDQWHARADAAGLERSRTMKKTEDRDLRTLDIVTLEVGLLEMQDGRSTPDDRRWADEVAASMRTRIAEYRRDRLPKQVPIKKAPPPVGGGVDVGRCLRLLIRLLLGVDLFHQEATDALLTLGEVLHREIDIAGCHRSARRTVVHEHVDRERRDVADLGKRGRIGVTQPMRRRDNVHRLAELLIDMLLLAFDEMHDRAGHVSLADPELLAQVTRLVSDGPRRDTHPPSPSSKSSAFSRCLRSNKRTHSREIGIVNARSSPPFGFGRRSVRFSRSTCSQRTVAASTLRRPVSSVSRW